MKKSAVRISLLLLPLIAAVSCGNDVKTDENAVMVNVSKGVAPAVWTPDADSIYYSADALQTDEPAMTDEDQMEMEEELQAEQQQPATQQAPAPQQAPVQQAPAPTHESQEQQP